MNRRTFLKYAGAAATAGSFSSLPVFAGSPTPVGIGLYTVRTEMAKGVAPTLEKLAGMGYREVEFAGYYDHSPKEIAKMLDGSGLKSPSAHIPLQVFETGFDQALELAHTVGHNYLILPWLQPEDRNLEKYKAVFDLLNKAGEKAKKAGIHVGYHNHEFEFDIIDGTMPYELLLSRTDPSLVKLQLDLFWMNVAGQDPVAMIDRQPGRVHLVHVKDRTAKGDMAAVGSGVIDFARIFKHAKKGGIKHYYVEHDNPSDPFEVAESSIRHLQTTFPRFIP